MNTEKKLNILLIEDNPLDARLVEEILKDVRSFDFQLNHCISLKAGLEAVTKEEPDIVLLDLALSDSFGEQTFTAIHEAHPDLPVILVSGLNDEALSLKLIKMGAQDYITKSNITSYNLEKSISYALERNILRISLKESEDQYRHLIENMGEGVGIMDTEEVFTFVNEAAERIFDTEKGALKGKSIHQFLTPEGADLVLKQTSNRKKKLISTYELDIVSKKRIKKQILVTATPNLDDNGTFIGTFGIFRDITARKRAEENLKNAEMKFRTLFGSTNDAVMVLDGSGFLDCNESTLKIFGCATTEEFCSNHPADLSPKKQADGNDSMTLANQRIATAMEKGSNLFEWIHQRADTGATFPAEVLLSRMELNGQQVLQATVRDITERKQTEEQLYKSEERFRQISENSEEWIWEVNNEGLYTYTSNIVEKMLGYKVEEIVGKKHFYDFFLDEEREDLKNAAFEVFKQKQSFQGFINRNKDNNGKIIWLSTSGVPLLGEKGELIGYRGVDVNITARKEAEQLQSILYNISQGVSKYDNLEEFIRLIKDLLSELIDTSNFYVAMYDRNTDTLSLPFHEDEKDKFDAIPAGKTLTGYVINTKKSLLADIELMNKLEQAGEIELIGSPSKVWLGIPLTVKGEVIGVLAVQSYDDPAAYSESDKELLEFVTEQISNSLERKRAELEIKNALEKATESDKLKSAFINNISHEIRTPLNAIMGLTEFLLDGTISDAERQEFTAQIRTSGNELLEIVEHIMDVAKLKSGSFPLTYRPCNPYQILNSVLITYINKEFEDHPSGIKLINDNENNDQLIFNSDDFRISQVLFYLIDNAIKFSKKGNVNINIGYHLKENNIHFYVKDTGIGIATDKHKEVFKIFTQSDNSNTREFGGVGIGLTLSKLIVEQLGGKIWVESEVGIGSCFYFTIPIEVHVQQESYLLMNNQ